MRIASLVSLLFVGLLPGQLPEDPGPYAAGFRLLSVPGLTGGNASVALRLHYPATAPGQDRPLAQAATPCPLVVFGHGFSLQAILYDSLYDHLASHGFVVAALATEEGLFTGNLPRFLVDFQAAVAGVRALAQDPLHPLAGAVAVDVRADAAGHSFGGAAALVAASRRPDLFRSVTSMAATASSPQGVDILAAVAALQVPALHFGASRDTVVPPGQNLDPIAQATPTSVRWCEIGGGTHSYFHERWGPDRLVEAPGTITVAEQQRILRRHWTAFLQWQHRGDRRAVDLLLGPTAVADPSLSRQGTAWRAAELFTSGSPSPGGVIGVHPLRLPGDGALVGVGFAGTAPTPFGTLGIDPASLTVLGFAVCAPAAFGSVAQPVPADPGLSGLTVTFQALLLPAAAGPALSPAVAVTIG